MDLTRRTRIHLQCEALRVAILFRDEGVALHVTVQRPAVDAQQHSSTTHVTGAAHHRFDSVEPLDLFKLQKRFHVAPPEDRDPRTIPPAVPEAIQ